MAKQTLTFLKNENRDFNNVLDSFLNLSDGGDVSGNTGLSAGTGFSDAAVYKSWKSSNGGVTKTSLLIDLTGIRSTAANDIIGNDGAASANIGQYTTAAMGTLFAITFQCMEAPAGGDPDIS